MQGKHIKVHKGGTGTWVGPNPKSYNLLRKAQSWCKVKFISITQKITMSQKCLQQKLENELKGRAASKCEKQLFKS